VPEPLPKAAVAVPAVPTRLSLHAALLALTFLTTSWAGTFFAGRPGMGRGELLLAGGGFAAALLGILLSHEMGHYIFARIHRVETSLPYVIPVPAALPGLGLISFGTLGAVIRMRSPIATRDALVDIGAAGPIAGAIVALPLLVLGLSWSHYAPSPTAGMSFWVGHNSLAGILVGWWQSYKGIHTVAGHTAAFGDDLLMRICERWVLGPVPAGQDVMVHPIAMAAWFGLLVTCLNLFPIGQLDGGHVTYALFGKYHRALGRVVGYGLLLMGLFSSISWLVWWLVTTRVVGYDHPPVQEQAGQMSPLRLVVCAASLVLFILTFIPVPMDTL
jgi:membrane-associated protease RseP (regulator of RpoE activity)